MAISLVYPTSTRLEQIAQEKLPELMADDPIWKFFPQRNLDESMLMWEQKDNYLGLQQVRGIGGEPPRVKPIGGKRYKQEPGIYGEHIALEEEELTIRRAWGSFGSSIDLSDLIMEKQDQLLERRLMRIKQIIWTLLATGTFSVAGPTGGVMHTDTFTPQTFSSVVPWSTPGTSTPWNDFSLVQLKQRGISVSFGGDAVAFMNRSTWNYLKLNTNAADLYGRRTSGFGTINDMNGVQALFQGDDLPRIVIYEKGYLDESGTFQLFLPTGKVVVIGNRPNGQVVGEYLMTRNANNPDFAPGSYMRVIDHGEVKIPRKVEVHDGHNGGPAIYYPSAICVMTVA